MPMCSICGGSQRVKLPIRFAEMSVNMADEFGDGPVASVPQCSFKEFDCPQCVPMVPYRRVRAMKVATAYEAEQFGKYQTPIERGIAARFGEYLMREGLIRFTTSGSKDLGAMDSKITITAHLGVVTREDVAKTGAEPEVAVTAAPKAVMAKIERQRAERIKRFGSRAKPWEPPPAPWVEPDEPITDEFDEPKDALANRFQGLEI